MTKVTNSELHINLENNNTDIPSLEIIPSEGRVSHQPLEIRVIDKKGIKYDVYNIQRMRKCKNGNNLSRHSNQFGDQSRPLAFKQIDLNSKSFYETHEINSSRHKYHYTFS